MMDTEHTAECEHRERPTECLQCYQSQPATCEYESDAMRCVEPAGHSGAHRFLFVDEDTGEGIVMSEAEWEVRHAT